MQICRQHRRMNRLLASSLASILDPHDNRDATVPPPHPRCKNSTVVVQNCRCPTQVPGRLHYYFGTQPTAPQQDDASNVHKIRCFRRRVTEGSYPIAETRTKGSLPQTGLYKYTNSWRQLHYLILLQNSVPFSTSQLPAMQRDNLASVRGRNFPEPQQRRTSASSVSS